MAVLLIMPPRNQSELPRIRATGTNAAWQELHQIAAIRGLNLLERALAHAPTGTTAANKSWDNRRHAGRT